MKKHFKNPLLLLIALLGFGFLQAQEPFITTWKTDNDGESNDNQITIPTGDGTFAYTVDWGDGTTDTSVYTGNATHTYATAGTYTVSISGDFPHLKFIYFSDHDKILSVGQWGDQIWQSMVQSFYYCANVQINAIDAPDLSQVTDMSSMFSQAEAFNGDINNWNVSNVTNMYRMFTGASAFNQDLNDWDVSKVTNMQTMFHSASVFDGNISNWNVSNVTNMSDMFTHAYEFNQDIGNWDVGNVEDMEDMFNGANSFNQDIGTWDVSKVMVMRSMFESATNFNQDIGSWDVSLVQDMSGMFADAISFNQDIGNWDVSNVIYMGTYLDPNIGFAMAYMGMFEGATAFNQNIGNWDVSNVLGMGGMFADATAFNQDISGWDVSNVQNMGSVEESMMPPGYRIGQGMFQGATAFDQNLGSWDISNVEDMYDIFDGAKLSTTNYDNTLVGWNTLNTAAGETKIPTDITFNGGNSTLCVGVTARQSLIDTYNWSITDAGEDCSLPFVTTWKTDNEGSSNDNQITIPTGDGTFAYTVDWGDGSTDTTVYTDDATHTYATADTYTVTISGDFPHPKFWSSPDVNRDKLVSIEQWGTQQWTSMYESFRGCKNLEYNATDAPDLSLVTNMVYMFSEATKFNGDISAWDVSNVTNMEGMFSGATSFNKDLNDWDVSGVENMFIMFYEATAFNGDIGNWDVGNVTDMRGMFSEATLFNKDLNDWEVSSVVDMSFMFQGATAFNGDIGSWDVGEVKYMFNMFEGATAFDQNLGGWDIGSVLGMDDMFTGAKLSTANYDDTLIGWNTLDTSSGETQIPTGITFEGGNSTYCAGATAKQDLEGNYGWDINDDGEDCPFITTWGISGTNRSLTIPTNSDYTYSYTVDWGDGSTSSHTRDVTHTYATAGTYTVSISGVFPHFQLTSSSDRTNLLSVEQWGGQVWQSMEKSFQSCHNMVINAVDLPDLSEVTNMSDMFYNASAFNQDISGWDVGNVTDMSYMFYNSNFNQDIGDWDVGNVTDMAGMFALAIAFNQDIGKWNVSNVTDMAEMFSSATAFNQDIGDWDVGNVTDMAYMFNWARVFNNDLSNWDVSSVTSMPQMFAGAWAFNQDIGDWDVSNVTNMYYMFDGASVFNNDLSNWNVSNVTEMTAIFRLSGMSTANYDKILIGWSDLTLQNDVAFGCSVGYCEGATARQSIIDTYGWTIADFGLDCDIVDSDQDGVQDDTDLCPDTPVGETVDANGCSDSQKDTDNDGTPDSEDAFPLDENENVDTDNDGTGDNADTDDDDDGTLDTEDAFPLDANEDTDTDGDGMGDNADTDTDDDDDGVLDENDICANTPVSETVDANGCSDSQKDSDSDGDGINDTLDMCPDTPAGETVGADGCSDSQKDSDFDGVSDAEDQCPNSPEDEVVDVKGCAESQKDDDNDGVMNNLDQCADTPNGETVDVEGCSDSQKEGDKVEIPVTVVSAQAFTPNGDGINDGWVIAGIENYPASIVKVYNRWGHEVFSAKGYQNDWGAVYKNRSEKVPTGSYYYIINLNDGSAPQDGWIFINY
ncbi:hypothetical protein CSC80_09575 [Maribacter sp. 6B07]|uniref:BspA family leucine-rich repeat surface protein n=1 Tax=Maribacter sp. 6B07 TaxID=2045442 RepID=UPI000C0796E1|nr:BspA family leucine-rich repeat surface protein [Maribacter sp. 6B07]PHN95553.1 hypothetical protein CSC80_09575 [Maribacter sp. 6B07]